MANATIWMCDLDGTGSMHPCLKGGPGAVAYIRADVVAEMAKALTEADETLTAEDACNIDPIVASDNPHERAAGLVRSALHRYYDLTGGAHD